jgi:hypothetical protein
MAHGKQKAGHTLPTYHAIASADSGVEFRTARFRG